MLGGGCPSPPPGPASSMPSCQPRAIHVSPRGRGTRASFKGSSNAHDSTWTEHAVDSHRLEDLGKARVHSTLSMCIKNARECHPIGLAGPSLNPVQRSRPTYTGTGHYRVYAPQFLAAYTAWALRAPTAQQVGPLIRWRERMAGENFSPHTLSRLNPR